RMEAWAVHLAVDECLRDGLDRQVRVHAFLRAGVKLLTDLLARLDEGMRKEDGLFSLAADTNLLGNWRAQLGAASRAALPWWLDGTLEAAARRCQAQMEADLAGLDRLLGRRPPEQK